MSSIILYVCLYLHWGLSPNQYGGNVRIRFTPPRRQGEFDNNLFALSERIDNYSDLFDETIGILSLFLASVHKNQFSPQTFFLRGLFGKFVHFKAGYNCYIGTWNVSITMRELKILLDPCKGLIIIISTLISLFTCCMCLFIKYTSPESHHKIALVCKYCSASTCIWQIAFKTEQRNTAFHRGMVPV